MAALFCVSVTKKEYGHMSFFAEFKQIVKIPLHLHNKNGIITSKVALVRSDKRRHSLLICESKCFENIANTPVALLCDLKYAVFPKPFFGLVSVLLV